MNSAPGNPGLRDIGMISRPNAWRTQQWFAAQDWELLTATAIPQWDCGMQQVRQLTLKASTTHTMAFPLNIKRGGVYLLAVRQDATGSAAITWTNQAGAGTNGTWKWAAATAPTITTTASASCMLTFYCDGVNMVGTSVLDLR
jgi:hypothetical protein